MKNFWPDAGPLKKGKKGYVYMTVLFIFFLLFVFLSFLLAVNNREGSFKQRKWENFKEDLALEDAFIEVLGAEKLEDLKSAFVNRRDRGKDFSKKYRLGKMQVQFTISDWGKNLGSLEGEAGGRRKKADLYLFHPIFEEEKPYLRAEDMSPDLEEKWTAFVRAPQHLRREFMRIGPEQAVKIKREGTDLVFYREEEEVYRQGAKDPLYLENLGRLDLEGPLSIGGVLLNKGEVQAEGCLWQGLYISDRDSNIRVRGQVLGQARTGDSIYDQKLALEELQDLPFFFDFKIKNIQSRPHDYF